MIFVGEAHMKKVISSVVILLLSVFAAHATHNRAGEITYRHISGLTYEVTITTYTKESSTQADRCELTIDWGDNTKDTLQRVNGPSIPDCPHGGETISGADLKKNIYIGVHTYSGPDNYIISFEDANRNSLVQNIPNSVNVPFYVETILVANPFSGSNTTPVLLNPPVDDACINRVFIHNPGAYDAEGDSLAYELTVCRGLDGDTIPGYTIPAGVMVDAMTGDLIWDKPTGPLGEFNFAIRIFEYRDGQLVGMVTRDLQVTVFNCDNHPPEIQTEDEICVEAGTLVDFPVTATDQDFDVVTLTATGGPLVPPNTAQFAQPVSGAGSVTSNFSWQTLCSHVRLQPYQVFFKAKDNGDPDLVDFHTTNIYVVGPSPKNPQAQPIGTNINVTWDASVCSEVTGYKIYRRSGYYGFIPDECETGVPSYTGYVQIGTTSGHNSTTFLDDNDGNGLLHGVDYCYMIVACHPDGSESYASLEVCAELKKDVPIITHVTVDTTDANNGEITVKWVKPTELDTNQIPGPYRYELYRSEGFSNSNSTGTPIQTYTGNLLSDLDADTMFVDAGINTVDSPYHYEIKLFATVNGDSDYEVGSTASSSVYQAMIETDRTLILSWSFNVPWNNYQYIVHRFNDTTQLWDSIAMVGAATYSDTGLVNGEEYCYYIEAYGEYSGQNLPSPLINLSQELCGVPIDTIPPCPPTLSVFPNCSEAKNLLTWDLPSGSCDDDAIAYRIYYTPLLNGDMELIATIYNLSDTSYLDDELTSIAGCYALTSIDSVLNESKITDTICVDNCPEYTLPNVFTPDGDNFNNFFGPFPYKYVKSVDIKIYNRWGNKVFETTDPNIGWDGKNKDTKLDCSDGVYYYVCEVNEIYLTGVKPRVLTGYIQLLRKK